MINDKEAFKKKLRLRVLTSPLSMIPCIGGFTVLFGAWVFDAMSVFTVGIPLLSILVGGGIAVSRIFLQTESIAKDVMEEMQKEADDAHERELNDLQRRLERDGDPRTEALLGDLRLIVEAFRKDHSWADGAGNSATASEILAKVNTLFDSCISGLEQTLEHQEKINRIKDPELSEKYSARRNAIIASAQESVRRLEGIHVRVDELTSQGGDAATAVDSVMDELDTHLRFAERADAEVRTMMDPNFGGEYDQHPTTTETE